MCICVRFGYTCTRATYNSFNCRTFCLFHNSTAPLVLALSYGTALAECTHTPEVAVELGTAMSLCTLMTCANSETHPMPLLGTRARLLRTLQKLSYQAFFPCLRIHRNISDRQGFSCAAPDVARCHRPRINHVNHTNTWVMHFVNNTACIMRHLHGNLPRMGMWCLP